ncbi:unnamed protein product [Rotaria sp. Silwood1]|nr:unnamed protein product [Rotaria sp. Silwood1]
MTTEQTSTLLLDDEHDATLVKPQQHDDKTFSNLFQLMNVLSYGTITFSDNKSHRADFIRRSNDVPPTQVHEFLTREWCDGRPSLVISITGGAKEYNMKPRLLRAFRHGLLKVARTTGAWIVTGGMNTGIMKLVGEIIQINPDRSRPIPLIGIATWGCVSGRKHLDVHGASVYYAKPRSNTRGEAPLEPNHTKFIFIDDGTERTYGREIAFRAQLEQAISGGFFSSKTMTSSSNQSESISGTSFLQPKNSDAVPVVLLVVEGGPNTVRTVHEAVVENNIPAVFLEGTGRCCDLFAKAFHLYNEYRRNIEPDDETSIIIDPDTLAKHYDELKIRLREDLKDELLSINGPVDTHVTTDHHEHHTDDKDNFDLVYECIHTRRNFLNIISLSSRHMVEPDIDLAILQALLKATSDKKGCETNIQRKREQLRLALEWNRVDIARNHIMKNETDWNIDLNDLFLLALKRNQAEFVELFLYHDFPLSDLFRNIDTLIALYTYKNNENDIFISNSIKDPLRTLYEKKIQPFMSLFFDVSAVILQKDFLINSEHKHENDAEKSGCCGTRSRNQSLDNTDDDSERIERLTITDSINMDIDRELFLWSVIEDRQDLALLFWSRGKNKISAALVAALIYKHYAHTKHDKNYIQSADKFEDLAVQILEKLYEANSQACLKSIIRQIPSYGNATWLELAVEANAKEFIAHRAVQALFNDIWFGYIKESVSDIKIVFSTFMLWYSGFLPYNENLVTEDDNTTLINSSNKSYSFVKQTSKEQWIGQRKLRKVSEYFHHIITFIRTPYVKYLYHLYSHLIFLLLFSYVILCDFFPLYDLPMNSCIPSGSLAKKDCCNDEDSNLSVTSYTSPTSMYNISKSVAYGLQPHEHPSFTEITLVIWVITLVYEELRQLFAIQTPSAQNAITVYFKSYWNQLDVVAIILFFAGITLRYIPISECFCAARIVLSFDLFIWFIRTLEMFTAVKLLGPKLVMIGEMVHDLKFFMLMFFVFILAFGVSFYSLVFGVQEFTWHLPRKIINLAYWHIFGEIEALETFDENFKANGYAAFILLLGYMTIVSILLVNLLIAMFSNTFDRLQSNADRIWKFQRYSLVCEYLSRPSLPPPFIFLSHCGRLTLYILAKCCKSEFIQNKYRQHMNRTKYKLSLDDKSITIIETTEDAYGDEVYYNYLKQERKLLDEPDLDEERIQPLQENILNRIRRLENHMRLISNQQAIMCDYLEHLMGDSKTNNDERIKQRERHLLGPELSFQEMNQNINKAQQRYRRESLFDDDRVH